MDPISDGPIEPDPIREAALRIVADAPPLTEEQLNKIRDLLMPNWRPHAGVRVELRHEAGTEFFKP